MQPTPSFETAKSLSLNDNSQSQEPKLKESITENAEMTNQQRLKTWISLIPESFTSQIRGFFEAVKCSNSVDVFDRHRIRVEYDTIHLCQIINKSGKDNFRITNIKLGLIRNMIYLYLAFNRKAEYNSNWVFISFIILTLGTNEEENFCIFAHLLDNVLAGFFLTTKNCQRKTETIADLYLLTELKKFAFTVIQSSALDLKSIKTLPQYSKNRLVRKKSFSNLFGFAKIFRSKTQSLSVTTMGYQTSNHSDLSQKTDVPLSIFTPVKNPALFSLVEGIVNSWFGSLFTNILSQRDCVLLWDNLFRYGSTFLYQFAIAVLTQAEHKLTNIVRTEKSKCLKIGVTESEPILFMLLPSMKKALDEPLSSDEFKEALNLALDDSSKMFVHQRNSVLKAKQKQIVESAQLERIKCLAQIRKELTMKAPFTETQVKAILKHIKQNSKEKILFEDLIDLFQKEHPIEPCLGSKIFSFIDCNLKGYLEPIEAKVFFILLTETPKKKLQLLWEEVSKKKPVISADEAIGIFQIIEHFIAPNSSDIDEKVADIYQTWMRVLPDENVSVKDFTEFFQKSRSCQTLLTTLKFIDGISPSALDQWDLLKKENGKDKDFESFIDFSINNEFQNTQELAKSKLEDTSHSDISLVMNDDNIQDKNRKEAHLAETNNIVTLFDSARKKIKHFTRSLSANKLRYTSKDIGTGGNTSVAKTSRILQKYPLLDDAEASRLKAFEK